MAYENEIASLLQQIKDLNNTPLPEYNPITIDQAKQQAQGQYMGQYDNLRSQMRNRLDLDAERRGIFNSPLAAGIMNEQSGKLENQYNSDVAGLANTLYTNSVNQTMAQRQQSQSERSSTLDRLNGLLAALQSERAYADAQQPQLGGARSPQAAPVDQTRAKYNAAAGWLNDVMNGKYKNQHQLSSAMGEWYQAVKQNLGDKAAMAMYNSVTNQYTKMLNNARALSPMTTPSRSSVDISRTQKPKPKYTGPNR